MTIRGQSDDYPRAQLGRQHTSSVDDADVVKSSAMERDPLDPASYDSWRLILSRPATKVKGSALMRELLTGTTVALAMVPESIAFSFVAGVQPVIGLQGSWMAMVITSLLGGMPAQVSGATGALAVLLPDFVEEFGVGHVFMAGIMMGLIEIVFGLIGGAKVVKLIGEPVMIGFANGLGLVIGLAQLHSFATTKFCPDSCDELGSSMLFDSDCLAIRNETFRYACIEYNTGATAGFQAMIAVATFASILVLPRLSTKIPAALAGIVIGIALEFGVVRTAGYETPTVGDTAGIPSNFNPLLPVWSNDEFNIPSLGEASTWSNCFPLALTMAVVGLTESLLTLQLLADITRRPGSGRAESIAQGVSNCAVGIFGGLPGCSLIGQSIISVSTGGRTRLATLWSGVFLLIIILVASPLLNLIPTASLAGLMFVVVLNTIQWASIPLVIASFLPEKIRTHPRLNWIKKVHRSDATAIVAVTVIAVVVNLAVAVGTGIVIAALSFSWQQEKRLDKIDYASPTGDDNDDSIEEYSAQLGLPSGLSHKDIRVYQIKGPVFFASSHRFMTMFNPENDPKHVVLYLDQAILADYSALVALNKVAEKYERLDKKLHLRKLTGKSLRTIRKAQHLLFTYDKTETEEVNKTNMLALELMPTWTKIPSQATPSHFQGETRASSGQHGSEHDGGDFDDTAGKADSNKLSKV